MGFTENANIPMVSSITDYIFKYLALRFLQADDLAEFGLDSANRIETHMPSIKDNSSEASGLIMESLAAKEPVVVATVAQPEVGQPRAEKQLV